MKPAALATGAALVPPAGAVVAFGLVLRPPVLRWDGRRHTGARLAGAEVAAARAVPGVLRIVVEADFLGVVARDREAACAAAQALQPRWHSPAMAAGAAPSEAPRALAATYRWPLPAGEAVAPWALAAPQAGGIAVWAQPGSPQRLRGELSLLLGLPPERVAVLANGQAPDDAALDVAADAAVLARAAGCAVRVEGEPRRPALAQCIEIAAGLDAAGHLGACVVRADPPLWRRPSLARLLTAVAGAAQPGMAGLPPYRHAATIAAAGPPTDPLALAADDEAMAPGRVFAHESFMDEAAAAAGLDPVQYRLAQLDDPRGAALVREVAERAGWGSPLEAPADARRVGRGFAYAAVVDEHAEPPRRSWAAWVAEVAVDPDTGALDVTRVVVGHDAEALAPMAAEAPALEGEVLAATRRLIAAPPAFDDPGGVPAMPEPGAATEVQVVVPRAAVQAAAPVAWSPAATLPAAAAVANAIFDATGVRLREPPFSGPRARRALSARTGRSRAYAWLGGLATAAAGLVVAALPWRPAIAPIDTPDLSLFSAPAIERGRLVAAAGDCVVCHTAPGGERNAGGLGLETPFGTVYSTNITPDAETGLGRWSFAAFERAMREGVHRDGRRLYPAFPYTAFAKLTEADMQALYAYLMSQPAVRAEPPRTELAFPFNLRPLLAGWNALFHDNTVYQPDPAQSLVWNRGAYLVQGAGHCGACHTPRNALGAEKRGERHYLAGGMAEGWEAPPLTSVSHAPVPWTEDDLYQYLRTGFSERHGVAAGPMAPVVHSLAELPDADIRAMAVYLASLQDPAPAAHAIERQVAALHARTAPEAGIFTAAGADAFRGACAVCHEAGDGPQLFGVKPSLALNTSVHSARPDNLIQVILAGIPDPPNGELGYMPGFAASFSDEQVVELVTYLRARFAPGKPAWSDLAATVARLRTAP